MGQVSACSTSAHAIGEAARVIASGDVDAMVAGGSEATVTALGVGGFNAMRALSTRNAEPQRASRPFDLDRDGFVMGEGAGVLILEEREGAIKRGAKILAELVGYGRSADAHHMTSPPADGEGRSRCMRMAMREAAQHGVGLSDVGYINAHGTLDQAGRYCRDDRDQGGVWGACPAGGDLLDQVDDGAPPRGGRGVEAAFSILALQEGILPPTINLEKAGSGVVTWTMCRTRLDRLSLRLFCPIASALVGRTRP